MTSHRTHSSAAPEAFATFGDLLHYLRRQARLTQIDLAVAVGYSREQITRLEHNQRSPDPTIVRALFLPLFADTAPAPLLDRLVSLAMQARAMRRHDLPMVQPRPTNLPAPLTSFIGRSAALSTVCDLVRQTRLVALIGAGGVGKTRLAIAAGHALRSTFVDGVWMVELAALREPSLLAATVAQCLGVPAGRSPEIALTDALHDKQTLLLLDNCEHLLVAAARLAEALLQAAPGLHVLATSRESLGILSATAWRVPSLSLPALPATTALSELLESEAVQLFVARASTAQPGFALTAHNAHAVAQICRRLDGMPLALELAATRVAVLSPQQIAARLADRFALLTDGNRTALPRHQTLRALVDWSYELLTPPEQELLQTVSVFVGGWTLEAAEYVSGHSDTLARLTSLVAKSLVVADEQDGAVRYHLLETIGAYARERLVQQGVAEAAQHRHLAWCRALARAADYAHPDPRQPAWHRRLAVEHDNLRAALAWALRAEPAAAVELVASLWYFWFWSGYWSEGAAWAVQALAATSEPSLFRAAALIGASNLAGRAGDYGTAAGWLAEGRRSADALENAEAMAWARISQSVYATDSATAEALLEEAIALTRASGNAWLEADAQCLLGDRARGQHDFDRAESCYIASRMLFEQLGSAEMCPWPIGNLGRLLAERGDHARATAVFADCVARCRAAQNSVGMVDWLLQLARAALASGDREQARQAVVEGLPIAHAIGNAEALIDWFVIGADLAVGREQYAQAASLLGTADVLLDRYHLLHRGIDLAAGLAYERSKEHLRGSMDAVVFEQSIAVGRMRPLAAAIAALSAIITDPYIDCL